MVKHLFNYLKIIFVGVFLIIYTSGCIKVEENISVDKMGSYEHSFSILMDSNIAELVNNMNSQDGTLQSRLHEILQELGFKTISDITGGNEVGSVGILEGYLNNLNLSDFNSEALQIEDNSKDYFVYKIYDIAATFKPYTLSALNNNIKTSAITDYLFTLNLPVEALSNAQNISLDKKTHTWYIEPNNTNTLEIKFEMLNITNTIILGCIILFLIVLALLLLRNYKIKQSTTKTNK